MRAAGLDLCVLRLEASDAHGLELLDLLGRRRGHDLELGRRVLWGEWTWGPEEPGFGVAALEPERLQVKPGPRIAHRPPCVRECARSARFAGAGARHRARDRR